MQVIPFKRRSCRPAPIFHSLTKITALWLFVTGKYCFRALFHLTCTKRGTPVAQCGAKKSSITEFPFNANAQDEDDRELKNILQFSAQNLTSVVNNPNRVSANPLKLGCDGS